MLKALLRQFIGREFRIEQHFEDRAAGGLFRLTITQKLADAAVEALFLSVNSRSTGREGHIYMTEFNDRLEQG